MRVRLKGLNCVRKRLADGSVVTYYYAWKGGPRLQGKLGSPEFIASYNAAVEKRAETPSGMLQSILSGYQRSTEFLEDLKPKTQKDYVRHIQMIEKEFGDFPLAALSDRRTRALFLEWRDGIAQSSLRQADYRWTVLARVLSWAKNRGLVGHNPCENGGRVYRGSRAEIVWTSDQETAFLRHAPPRLHLPLQLALWTGQRQADLLNLKWSAYDGSKIRLKQSKGRKKHGGGRHVVIPIGAPLKRVLDGMKQSPQEHILLNSDGCGWTEDGFRSSWRKAVRKAGVEGVTFNDLRGTAVTRLALSGCTEAEIATITGHTMRQVRDILDKHYLKRDERLAESAIRKREAYEESTSATPAAELDQHRITPPSSMTCVNGAS